MTQRARKLVGTVALIVLVLSYAMLAMLIAVGRLAEAPAWVHAGYFFVTGLLWVIPAGLLIRWMQRP